jgi:glycosyltransferase involved in cell wall biosynthesis
VPIGLGRSVRRDLEKFAPNIVHLSSPDPSAHAALRWAQAHDIPVLASVHTRFETYPRYYKMAFLEPLIIMGLRRFYNRCDGLVAPSQSMIDELLAMALERAALCSNDPFCASHEPNSELEKRYAHGAACHGCLLIAETSCERRNEFLDRALVVPTLIQHDAAFFTESP